MIKKKNKESLKYFENLKYSSFQIIGNIIIVYNGNIKVLRINKIDCKIMQRKAIQRMRIAYERSMIFSC